MQYISDLSCSIAPTNRNRNIITFSSNNDWQCAQSAHICSMFFLLLTASVVGVEVGPLTSLEMLSLMPLA